MQLLPAIVGCARVKEIIQAIKSHRSLCSHWLPGSEISGNAERIAIKLGTRLLQLRSYSPTKKRVRPINTNPLITYFRKIEQYSLWNNNALGNLTAVVTILNLELQGPVFNN